LILNLDLLNSRIPKRLNLLYKNLNLTKPVKLFITQEPFMLIIILEKINTKIINSQNSDKLKVEEINQWTLWLCSWWWCNPWLCKDSLCKVCSDKEDLEEWDPCLDKEETETKIPNTEVKTLEDKITTTNKDTKIEEENKTPLPNKPDLNKNKTPNLPFKVWKKIFKNSLNMTNKNNPPC